MWVGLAHFDTHNCKIINNNKIEDNILRYQSWLIYILTKSIVIHNVRGIKYKY